MFADVEQLCTVHIPNWLASPGMDATKIATFYDDPIKRASDQASTDQAYQLRSVSIDDGLIWSAQRWARFVLRAGIGAVRQLRATTPHSSTNRTSGKLAA